MTIAGCGKPEEQDYSETTLSFDKDGKVTAVIVEAFSEDEYSKEGLEAYFNEKISEYNSTNIGSGDIDLKELSVENGYAKAKLVFDSCDTYTAFYGIPTFCGTINDAYDKGYITETVLKKTHSTDTLSKNDLMKISDREIIVVSEVVRVECPKKVEYVSANVETIDDRNVRVSTDSTGMAYILLK